MAPQFFRDTFVILCGVVEVGENAVRNVCSLVRGRKPKYGSADSLDPARGKTVLITGGSSGVGFVVAKSLAERGAHVIITSRSADRGEASAQKVQLAARDAPDGGTVSFMKLDLASMSDVKSFAERVAKLPKLDVLVCNAGLMCPMTHTLTEDGMEVQFQTNHLGHFVVAAKAASEHLKMASQGRRQQPLRVVCLTSVTARAGNMHWDDLQGIVKYTPFKSYAQSKLACMMTSVELHDRCQQYSQELKIDSSRGVTCTSVHPGLVDTPLARYYFENDYLKPAFLRPVLRPLIKALFPVALLKPELSVQNMDLAMFGSRVERKYVRSNGAIDVFGEARSSEARGRLWDKSVELAGIRNPFQCTV